MTWTIKDAAACLLYEKSIGKSIAQRDAGNAKVGNLKKW